MEENSIPSSKSCRTIFTKLLSETHTIFVMDSVLQAIECPHDVFTIENGDRRLSDEIDNFKSRESTVFVIRPFHSRWLLHLSEGLCQRFCMKTFQVICSNPYEMVL